MTLLIITLTLLILGGLMIGVFVICDNGSDIVEWLGVGGFVFVFFGIVLALSFITCVFASSSNRFNEDKKHEYMEKRKTLIAELENCSQDKIPEVYDDVRAYNLDIINGRTWNKRAVTKWITYDVWDDLELIDLGDYARNPYSVEIISE